MKIFSKELKTLVFSAMFVIYTIFVVAFVFLGYIGRFYLVSYELPEIDPYDEVALRIPSDDANRSINWGYAELVYAYLNNSYPAYNERISLSDFKQNQIKKIIDEIRPYDPDYDDEIAVLVLEDYIAVFATEYEFEMTLAEYQALMLKAGNIVGRDSDYSRFPHFSREMVTYEQAVDYHTGILIGDLFESDKLTNGLARVYGTTLTYPIIVFPCFIAMYSVVKDREMRELLYSKGIKSYRFILAKFCAIATASLLPLLMVSLILPFHAKSFVSGVTGYKINVDYLAYVKINFLWHLPTILFVVSLAMLVSYSVGSLTSLAVPVLLVFVVFSYPFLGACGLHNIVILFKSEYMSDVYRELLPDIYLNRLLYTSISIVLTLLSASVYNMKRKAVNFENKAKFNFTFRK